jgi:prepilin-type N-terminal cleavage/methylation domain-containing protein
VRTDPTTLTVADIDWPNAASAEFRRNPSFMRVIDAAHAASDRDRRQPASWFDAASARRDVALRPFIGRNAPIPPAARCRAMTANAAPSPGLRRRRPLPSVHSAPVFRRRFIPALAVARVGKPLSGGPSMDCMPVNRHSTPHPMPSRTIPPRPAWHRGFTLVELLVVVAIIALLISLLLPSLGRAQRAAKTLNDAVNISQIHKGFLSYANADPRGRLPIPGLVSRLPTMGAGPGGAMAIVPGQGEEDITKNNSANLYSSMIAANVVTPEILFSPVETNPIVRQMANYNFRSFDPAGTTPTFWDPAFLTNIHQVAGASAAAVCHTSYAHLALIGDRKKLYWTNKAGATRPVLGNRGPHAGAISGDNYRLSYTLLFHDPNDTWEGNVCYGDNHVNLEKSVIPDTVQFECGFLNLKKDNIYTFTDFSTDGCKGVLEGDTWLCIAIGQPGPAAYTCAPERLTTGALPAN